MPPPWPSEGFTNAYDFVAVDVSGDGSLVSQSAFGECARRSTLCGYANLLATQLSGDRFGGRAFSGVMRFSPNGKFAFGVGYPHPPVGDYTFEIVDLSSGGVQSPLVKVRAGSPQLGYGRVIANDGTAVFSSNGRLYVGRTTGISMLQTSSSEDAWSPSIDAGGKLVVYESFPKGSNTRKLKVFDLQKLEERLLVDGDVYGATISNDGRRVLFLSTARFDGQASDGTPQAFLIESNATSLRQITRNYAGIQPAILSGNGEVCYVVTRAGRVFRLDLTSGDSLQIVGRTSVAERFTGGPGKLVRLRGVGLAELRLTATAPLPDTLGGFRIRLNGQALPILSVAPNEVLFQLPWDLGGPADQLLEMETDAEPGFEVPPVPMVLASQFAEFELLNAAPLEVQYVPIPVKQYVLAAHAAFDALVSPQNPARPNEIVHLYARGVGGVDPAVPIGEIGPGEPPAVITGSFACGDITGNSRQEMEVLYAGLAPGTIGFYQISVRIPSIILGPDLFFVCGPNTTGAVNFAWAFLPVEAAAR